MDRIGCFKQRPASEQSIYESTSMELPQSPTRLKLWRWLLLLSVATVALGGFVWWKSRSERLQFVETI